MKNEKLHFEIYYNTCDKTIKNISFSKLYSYSKRLASDSILIFFIKYPSLRRKDKDQKVFFALCCYT